ncbi:MAG: hypothetical protein ACTSWY_05510 [Promethearchaeota archaeon]
MEDINMKFNKITEHIFSVFNTFVFLNLDEITFEKNEFSAQERLIKKLNMEPIKINNGLKIMWKTESAGSLKISKGVYTPVSKEDSFLMGIIIKENPGKTSKLEESNNTKIIIKESINENFPVNSLSFGNIEFYLHTSGVGTCRTDINIEKTQEMDGITIQQLEQISEKLNELYRKYFAEVCYNITRNYIFAVRELGIPHYQFEFIPDVLNFSENDKMEHTLPWSHRLYEIRDDKLLEMENPGEQFKTLLTPSKKMDIEDFSIYDNRYIYFGWGHSILFTSSDIKGSDFSQTNKTPREYVRLIEIAQNNWRAIEMMDNLMNYSITYYNLQFKGMRLKQIRQKIYDIRDFNKAVDRVMDSFRGVKISFDTETRSLLKELNDRWLTDDMFDKLNERQDALEDLLNDLFQRQQEKKDDSLNAIVMLFTIISLFDVFGVFFDILTQGFIINWIAQLLVLISGTLSLGMLIILYVRLSEKK